MRLLDYEYIFFDLDGTLTESHEGITKSLYYALEKNGIKSPTPEALKVFIGPPMEDTLRTYFGLQKDEEIKNIMTAYRERFSDIGIFENKVYDGIEDMLQAIQNSGRLICMATSKPEPFARRIAEYFKLDKYFKYIGGNDFQNTRRTKASVIKYVMQEMGIDDVRNVLMVGDRVHDVDGARECGIDCLGVLYGYGSKEELKNAGVTYIVENVADISGLI